MPSRGAKRPSSVASRYLAAIDCTVPEPPVSNEHPLSPPKTSWKELDESFSSSSKSAHIQSRSTGNSPSSSRRSRASNTPPRDSAVDLSCSSGISPFPHRKASFFPATTAALNTNHDTDESSLTSPRTSRSSSPSLHEAEVEQDEAVAILQETRERIDAKLKRQSGNADWRNRMDGTLNYSKRKEWRKKKASPKHQFVRTSPDMARSSSSFRRSPDAMTDVTGTSTEVITNRASDILKRSLPQQQGGDDERDTADLTMRRPQHEQNGEEQAYGISPKPRPTKRSPPSTTTTRRWQQQPPASVRRSPPPPPRQPIDINSLLSDSTNDESAGRSTPSPFPHSLPTTRLGNHLKTDSTSGGGSFQERSLTSSVGVETGVHVVSKSTPALKRVFGNDPEAVQLPSDGRLLPHDEEEAQSPTRQDVVRPFPPKAPSSFEKQANTSNNPFWVRYSARGSPIHERRGMPEQVDSPGNSSGGWTPVALSSSGMVSEDFVLDQTTPHHHENPIKPLFSADRVPSTSRSPFAKYYREDPSNEASFDSLKVGPPDIHRITSSNPPVTSVPMVVSPTRETTEMREMETGAIAVEQSRTTVEHGQVDAMVEPERDTSPIKSLSSSRVQRRLFLHRKHHWPPQKEDIGGDDDADKEDRHSVKSPIEQADTFVHRNTAVPSERDGSGAWASRPQGHGDVHRGVLDVVRNVNVTETGAVTENVGIHSADVRFSSNVRPASASRGAEPQHVSETTDRNVDVQETRADPRGTGMSEPKGEGTAVVMSSPPSVRDRINAFSPSNSAAANYVPPWSKKLRQMRSPENAKEDDMGEQDDRNVGDVRDHSLTASAERAERDSDARVDDHGQRQLPAEDVLDTARMVASPPSSSVQDRIRAFSAGKLESARPAPIDVPSHTDARRDLGETRLTSPPATSTTGDDSAAMSGMTDESIDDEVLQTRKSTKGNPAGALPISAESSLTGQSAEMGIQRFPLHAHAEEPAASGLGEKPKTPRKSLVLGAHLAATADDVSPQERYRMRLKMADDATGTEDSTRDKSDVRSLKSFFEASLETAPSDESDIEDDRTVESIRSIFEPSPEDEEPSAVSKMRAMFEKQSAATSGRRSFGGNNAVSDAFTKFEPSRSNRAVSSGAAVRGSVQPSRIKSTFLSPQDGATMGPDAKEAATNSASTKLQSTSAQRPRFEYPNQKSVQEETSELKATEESGAVGVKADEAVSDQPPVISPPVMSVAERIRALKLKQSPQADARKDVTEADVTPRTAPRFSKLKESPQAEARKDVTEAYVTPRTAPRFAKLKESPQGDGRKDVTEADVTPRTAPRFASASPPSTKSPTPIESLGTPSPAAVSQPRWKRRKPAPDAFDASNRGRVSPRDSNVAAKTEPISPADTDRTPRKSPVQGTSYPSVMDRINAFSLKSPEDRKHVLQRFKGESLPHVSAVNQGSEENVPHSSTRALYGREEVPDVRTKAKRMSPPSLRTQPTDEITEDLLKAKRMSPPAVRAQPTVEITDEQYDGVTAKQSGSDQNTPQTSTAEFNEASTQPFATKKQLKTEGSHAAENDAASEAGSEYDDGVTLDLSIAEISGLTNPTCLRSKEGGAESSTDGEDSSDSSVDDEKEQEGKGPSEASSSQTSEAAAPLIARMKFSDESSASLHSPKGTSSGRTGTKWEPLTPVVDETRKSSPTANERESAWSPESIDATFPMEQSNIGGASSRGNKLWEPIQAENWEASPSFGADWTPPAAAIDPFETPVSDSRLSDVTPLRRNTAISPSAKDSTHQSSPTSFGARGRPLTRAAGQLPESSVSPTHGVPFRRTHPARLDSYHRRRAASNQTSPPQYEKGVETAPRRSPPPRSHLQTSPTSSASPRSSPSQQGHVSPSTMESAVSPRASPTTPTGVSKHALLMSKLRSLKEARMRRTAAAGFHRNTERPSRRPPTGSSHRASPTSALAPFLRPGFGSPPRQQSRPLAQAQAGPYRRSDDDNSASTRSSTGFGGHKFKESLEVD